MQGIEQTKFVMLAPPQVKDNGQPARETYVDTKGYGHLRVLIILGEIDADIATAAPSVSECDTTDGTYTDISGAIMAAVAADGDDDEMHAIDVDLMAGTRKRYMQCELTTGDGTTGTNLCVLGILSKKTTDDHDGLATDAGLDELVSA